MLQAKSHLFRFWSRVIRNNTYGDDSRDFHRQFRRISQTRPLLINKAKKSIRGDEGWFDNDEGG